MDGHRQLHVRITDEDHERLRQIARRHDVHVSTLIRRAIRDFIRTASPDDDGGAGDERPDSRDGRRRPGFVGPT